VQGHLQDKTPFNEETVTLVVNAHGALLRLNAETRMGETVVLQMVSTNESQEGKVVFVSEGKDAKFHVGIELTEPTPHFWHVSFPLRTGHRATPMPNHGNKCGPYSLAGNWITHDEKPTLRRIWLRTPDQARARLAVSSLWTMGATRVPRISMDRNILS
jgi:hypothetical protein